MTTKQYLGQLVNIDRRIKDQMSEYEKWISIATSTGSNSGNTDRVMSSGSQDKMADAVAKAIDYSIESNENAILLTNLKHTITNQICGIKNEQFYNVLFSHFVDGEKIEKEDIVWNIKGEDFTNEEMAADFQTHWAVTTPAVLKVKKPGGLAQGYHDLKYGFCFTSSYMPPIIQSNLDPDQESMIFMPEFGHHVNERRLLIV